MVKKEEVEIELAPPKDDLFSREQLSRYNGSDRPELYVAVKGTVFDVTNKADKYGKGKSYYKLVGRDCSRALGMSTMNEQELSREGDLEGLTDNHLGVLDDWYVYFAKRYNIMGVVVGHD